MNTAAATPPATTSRVTTTPASTPRERRCFAADWAIEETFRSSVFSIPLMASGMAPVGSTPPSGRFIASTSVPPAGFAAGAGLAGSGALRAAISSFASAARALAPAGFQPGSGAAGVPFAGVPPAEAAETAGIPVEVE
ncbi:MAG: hypothetical protein U0229_05090 [Anaeromyxobacter sp.]